MTDEQFKYIQKALQAQYIVNAVYWFTLMMTIVGK